MPKQMGGGSVDPATGSFNFAVLEGYMIRNGRIAEPVRGATLIGKGAEVLRDIDMVGNNLKRAQGMCGSKERLYPDRCRAAYDSRQQYDCRRKGVSGMERKEFLEKVLAYGRQAGFADCEVYYRGGKAFEVLILEGEVSDYENSREEGLAFRGNINGRTGYAYTEQLTEDAIAYLVETAKENAALLSPEDCEELYAGEENYPELEGVNTASGGIKGRGKNQRRHAYGNSGTGRSGGGCFSGLLRAGDISGGGCHSQHQRSGCFLCEEFCDGLCFCDCKKGRRNQNRLLFLEGTGLE